MQVLGFASATFTPISPANPNKQLLFNDFTKKKTDEDEESRKPVAVMSRTSKRNAEKKRGRDIARVVGYDVRLWYLSSNL